MKRNKPVFACDLDGIVCDWDRGVRMCLRKHLGISVLEQESPHWDYVNSQLTPEQYKWLWSEGIKKGMYTLGGFYKGSPEAIRKLDELTELWILTSRPLAAQRVTERWVRDKLNLSPHKLWFVHESRDKVNFDANFFLDDSPDVLTRVAAEGKDILGWKRRWNEKLWEDKDITWVDSWPEVIAYVQRR